MSYENREIRQPGIPLRLDRSAVQARAATTIHRACAAFAKSFRSKVHIDEIVRENWRDDRDVGYLVKNSVSPDDTVSAAALSPTLVSDYIGNLTAASAGAALLAAGLSLEFGRNIAVKVPGFIPNASYANWVQQGQPRPVFQMLASAVTLNLFKLESTAIASREMVDSSAWEANISDTMRRSVALQLDASLFDSNAAVPQLRPAGLRHAISPLTASTSTDPHAAMVADVATLVAAVSSVAGNQDVIFIVNPARAAAMELLTYGAQPFKLLASSAIALSDVICVAPQGLASAMGATPGIETFDQAVLHTEDGSPAPIGGPGGVAAPSRSLWQTDCTGLRLRLPVSWALRTPLALSWLSTTARAGLSETAAKEVAEREQKAMEALAEKRLKVEG